MRSIRKTHRQKSTPTPWDNSEVGATGRHKTTKIGFTWAPGLDKLNSPILSLAWECPRKR